MSSVKKEYIHYLIALIIGIVIWFALPASNGLTDIVADNKYTLDLLPGSGSACYDTGYDRKRSMGRIHGSLRSYHRPCIHAVKHLSETNRCY